MLAFIPKNKRVSKNGKAYWAYWPQGARSFLGEYMWENYRAFLRNCARAAANPERYDAHRQKAFSTPLAF